MIQQQQKSQEVVRLQEALNSISKQSDEQRKKQVKIYFKRCLFYILFICTLKLHLKFEWFLVLHLAIRLLCIYQSFENGYHINRLELQVSEDSKFT